MSLRKKTLALFLILGISMWVGSYLVPKTAVLPAFEEFERQASMQALTRVTRMLSENLRAIVIMNMEYSLWNPTYEYARGQREEYVDENLDRAYWQSIGINLLAIFDAQGNERYSWTADASGTTDRSLADELLFTLEAGHPLITHDTIDSSVGGLLNMRSGIMQLVSRPILTSEGEGPIAGTFIVGQTLSAERVKKSG